ncbi:GNAT family N-acetyltransferase [Actinophytocola sediminis]
MVSLRPTVPADLAAVTAWEADRDTACWLGDTGPAWHRRALSDPAQEHLIAVHDARAVGFLVLAGLAGQEIELRRLVIARAHRGAGLGGALLRAAIDRAARTPGATEIWLDVKAGNDRARTLYASAGFTVATALGELIFLSRPVTTTSEAGGGAVT